jgi:hypothetical protein
MEGLAALIHTNRWLLVIFLVYLVVLGVTEWAFHYFWGRDERL